MKFTVSNQTLLTHLQSISRVISSKNPLAIMDCFLFTIEGNQLRLKATDQDTTLTTEIELIESDSDGLFAVGAKTILDALRELPDQPLTVQVNVSNWEIIIFYQNGKYNFVGQDGEDFPVKQPLGEDVTRIELSVEDMLNGVNRTLFASSDDELRPVMNGVLIDAFEDNVTFVATDTHKLVRFKNFKVKNSGTSNFILPKKPANLLRNILAKETGSVEIVFDNKNAHFVFGSYKMECRLIEGRFPNYNAVIPQSSPFTLTIDRALFLSALKRVSVFANQTSNLIRLELLGTQINISAQDLDFSTSAEETIQCQFEGNPMRIGFKAQNLIEILSNVQSVEVKIGLADSARPGIVTPATVVEDEDIQLLIMPMMLND